MAKRRNENIPRSRSNDAVAVEEYQPSQDEIAQHAYARYAARGGGHGRDQEDWYEAERELRKKGPSR